MASAWLLVGSRERTPEREKEMFYQPAGRGVYVPFAAVAEFDPEPATDARIRLIDLNRASTITCRWKSRLGW